MLVEAVRTRTVPYSLQFAGLAMGIFGALLLTIPDHLCALWSYLTHCGDDQEIVKEDETAVTSLLAARSMYTTRSEEVK